MPQKTSSDFFISASAEHLKKQRQEGRKLKKTRWWQSKLKMGKCYYCEKTFKPEELNMDHLVALVRGGLSIKNNVVPSCKKCNFEKKHKSIQELRLNSRP